MGKKPLWELWAENTLDRFAEAKRLRADGAFTINDFRRKCPKNWTRDRTAKVLEGMNLKSVLAWDNVGYNCRPVKFYFPPDKA